MVKVALSSRKRRKRVGRHHRLLPLGTNASCWGCCCHELVRVWYSHRAASRVSSVRLLRLTHAAIPRHSRGSRVHLIPAIVVASLGNLRRRGVIAHRGYDGHRNHGDRCRWWWRLEYSHFLFRRLQSSLLKRLVALGGTRLQLLVLRSQVEIDDVGFPQVTTVCLPKVKKR